MARETRAMSLRVIFFGGEEQVVLAADIGSAVGVSIARQLLEARDTVLAVGNLRSDKAQQLLHLGNIIETGVFCSTK